LAYFFQFLHIDRLFFHMLFAVLLTSCSLPAHRLLPLSSYPMLQDFMAQNPSAGATVRAHTSTGSRNFCISAAFFICHEDMLFSRPLFRYYFLSRGAAGVADIDIIECFLFKADCYAAEGARLPRHALFR